MNDPNLSWCGGFFDGEGSFSFGPGCPYVSVVNTNPLAVSSFFEIMKKNNIDFKISERSKPSKSSKKKRWDMYMMDRKDVSSFLEVMQDYICGKKKQIFLIKNFYDETDQKKRKYSDIVDDYHQIMMYYNQISNLIIIDENKLFEKLGFQLDFNHHEIMNDYNTKIEVESFNDLFYLAGIIDAEGTVYINKRNVNNSYDRYIPSIGFVNTNKEIIKKCCSTLKNNGIGYHVQSRINSNRNRVRWDVSVTGVKRVEKLSNLLIGKLIIKNRQIELIHKYCSFRLDNILSKNDFANSFKESIEVLNKEN
jgi:hypothetical protein